MTYQLSFNFPKTKAHGPTVRPGANAPSASSAPRELAVLRR